MCIRADVARVCCVCGIHEQAQYHQRWHVCLDDGPFGERRTCGPSVGGRHMVHIRNVCLRFSVNIDVLSVVYFWQETWIRDDRRGLEAGFVWEMWEMWEMWEVSSEVTTW